VRISYHFPEPMKNDLAVFEGHESRRCYDEKWAEVSVKAHKELKGLKTQNLRDRMSEAELIFTALPELSTRRSPRASRPPA